jgi:hypothetical protein
MLDRNGALFDTWSVIHLLTGVIMGWLISPLIAFILMAAWEPFEIFVLSPLLAKKGIVFGYENLRNSLSDIFFNGAGILIGAYVLSEYIAPPFTLFQ